MPVWRNITWAHLEKWRLEHQLQAKDLVEGKRVLWKHWWRHKYPSAAGEWGWQRMFFHRGPICRVIRVRAAPECCGIIYRRIICSGR